MKKIVNLYKKCNFWIQQIILCCIVIVAGIMNGTLFRQNAASSLPLVDWVSWAIIIISLFFLIHNAFYKALADYSDEFSIRESVFVVFAMIASVIATNLCMFIFSISSHSLFNALLYVSSVFTCGCVYYRKRGSASALRVLTTSAIINAVVLSLLSALL